MYRRHTAIVLCCLGLPPPVLALVPPEAPWDSSPAPFVYPSGDPDTGPRLKVGEGHATLNGPAHFTGNTFLLQGSLGLESDQALGAHGNTLDQWAGTRLDLADGLLIDTPIQVHATDPNDWLPVETGLDPIVPATDHATWRVEHGIARLRGVLTSQVPLVKDGAGTLSLMGYGMAPDPTFTVREGGLRVDGLWYGSVLTAPGTVLSGTGLVRDARIAGDLRPGAPEAPGTLMIGDRLALQPGATTHIRIDGAQSDQLWSLGSARLGGGLRLDFAAWPTDWTPHTHWILVQADGGLEFGPDGAPDPVPGDGRFAWVAANTPRYLDPVLDYAPTQARLSLRYNPTGLDSGDAAWRGGLIEDSRFLREAALAHGASGRAWAQSWWANTRRDAAAGAPGDTRDTGGLQLGISRALGADWHVSAFAGVQQTHQKSDPWRQDAADRHRASDQAAHLGLGASRALGNARLSLGAAHAWHRADASRLAAPGEASLTHAPQARLAQAWVEARLAEPIALGRHWRLAPSAQLAWLSLHRAATRESGGPAAVQYAAQTDRRAVSHLALEASRPWPTPHGEAVFAARLGMRTLWGSQTLGGTQAYRADPGQSFQVEGLPLARHLLSLDVGVHAPIHPRVRLGLSYTGQAGGGTLQHGAWLRMSVDVGG
jgi:uncharacterized protein with beta-barrel porin domain